jgi:hypothetical protein
MSGNGIAGLVFARSGSGGNSSSNDQGGETDETIVDEIVVTASTNFKDKDGRKPPRPGGGGPNSGCIKGFNACVKKASSYPEDSEANREYLSCRQHLKVCVGLEKQDKPGFGIIPGVGIIFVVGGESYFIPFP